MKTLFVFVSGMVLSFPGLALAPDQELKETTNNYVEQSQVNVQSQVAVQVAQNITKAVKAVEQAKAEKFTSKPSVTSNNKPLK